MFENAGLWLKRNFKAAYKSVTLGAKQYIPFFVALLIIEAMFFGSALMFSNNYTNDELTILEEYDYHLAITGLDKYQAEAIHSKSFDYVRNLNQQLVYDPVGEIIEHNGTYDVYIWLNTHNKKVDIIQRYTIPDDLAANYVHFVDMFKSMFDLNVPIADEESADNLANNVDKDIASSITITKSPLYLLEQREEDNQKLHRIVDAILLIISVFILTSLFSVRANHYKFLYGIYASFGAHSRRLRTSAMWEMAICGLLVLIPALLLALGISLGIFLPNDIAFSFALGKILWVIPLTLIVIVISVYMPMKMISRKEPLSLIVSDDNSNLIHSPKTSFKDFIKFKFPSSYERLGAWRFRGYNLRLALVSSVFCILFISGIYLADLYATDKNVTYNTTNEYTIKFDEDGVIDDETMSMFETDGIVSIHKSHETTKASDVSQHVLINKSDVKAFSGLMKNPNVKKYFILNDINYHCAVDTDYLEVIDETYEYEGDLNSIFEKENHIIIGNSYNNKEIFKFDVGDTIRLAVLTRQGRQIADTYSGNTLLKLQLKYFTYEYIDFTVGAIITNYPSALDGMPLVMAKDDYEYVSAEFISNDEGRKITPAQANAINLRVDYSLSGEELDELDRTLRDTADFWDGKLYKSGTHFEHRLENTHMYEDFIVILACILLVFIPLVWFFNQLLFYRKRQNEFYILQSISAPMSRIRDLHLQSGIIMIPLAIVSLIAATVVVALIYCVTTFLLPGVFSIGSAVLVDFSISPLAYVVSFALTFISSMLSAYVPYYQYKKSQLLDISIEYDD